MTPAIFAFLGWRLDEWLGTTPLFLLVLFLFTFTYVAWREYTQLQAADGRAPGRAPRPRSRRRAVVTAADRHAPVPDAPEVERELAFDMLKRGVWFAPLVLLVATMIWGVEGAASAALAIALVQPQPRARRPGPVVGRQDQPHRHHGRGARRLRRAHGPRHRGALRRP